MRNLELACDGRGCRPRFESAELAIAPGAGGSPVMRITAHLKLPVAAGSLTYADRNFPDRAGWKEVVIAAGPGASIERASQDETRPQPGADRLSRRPDRRAAAGSAGSVAWMAAAPRRL